MSNFPHHCPHHQHPACDSQNCKGRMAFLDSQTRRDTLSPEEILGMLSLEKGCSLLDVGAGSGYLTIPAAQQTKGLVFALDRSEHMLQVIQEKARTEKISTICLLKGDAENIPLAKATVDIGIASLVLHEVESLSKVLAEINRVLKVGGQLACVEYEKEESAVQGPPMHMRIASGDMEAALVNGGFVPVRKVFPKENLYILIAHKPEANGE